LLTGGAFQNSLLQLDKKSGDGDDNQTVTPRGTISKAILNQLKEQHKLDLKAQMNKYLAQIKDLQDKNYDLKTNNMNLKRINHDYERRRKSKSKRSI
jgi:ABC-type phosphate transport system auxiliary subunit